MKLIFIVTAVFIGVFLYTQQLLASQKSFIYEYYEEGDSSKVIERHFVEIEDISSGERLFKRKIEGKNYTKNEQFVLDSSYETQTWKVSCLDEDTEYVGEKKGNALFIKGKLKGEKINKRITLDYKPFYYTPKFNLSKFALSDSKEIKFWMLRKDKLTKYLMQAKKIGEETILINGEEIEVIKVYYSATGMGEKFYRREYFFRKSDGLFVKKGHPDSQATSMVLISESNKEVFK